MINWNAIAQLMTFVVILLFSGYAFRPAIVVIFGIDIALITLKKVQSLDYNFCYSYTDLFVGETGGNI